MIIESIVERHATEAALLWALRDAATRLASYDLKRLGHLDERVEAHLDGLRIAGDAGWEICKDALSEEPGEVFAAAVLATERRDLQGIADILDLGAEIPHLARALSAGLGWAPVSSVTEILPGFFDPACPPPLQYLGIAACAAHRLDPGEALTRAILHGDASILRRALKAAGELGRVDLLHNVRARLGADSIEVRFGAAWSAVLLGDRSAVNVLHEIAAAGGRDAAAALSLAVRRTDAKTASGWIHDLAAKPETCRVAIIGAGALGDATLVPWLLSLMDTPELARLAGDAFTFITGIEIEGDLAGDAPPDFEAGPTDDPEDEDVAPDPDFPLPWPDVAAVRARWEGKRGSASSARQLLGRPIAQGSLREILRTGTQPRRAAAAIELTLLSPGEVLFEVRAPAFRQRRVLGS